MQPIRVGGAGAAPTAAGRAPIPVIGSRPAPALPAVLVMRGPRYAPTRTGAREPGPGPVNAAFELCAARPIPIPPPHVPDQFALRQGGPT